MAAFDLPDWALYDVDEIGSIGGVGTSDVRIWIDPAESQFGAVGDGITDDTAALQACFDYAATNRFGVFLRNRTYLVSSELQLTGSPIEVAGPTLNYNGSGNATLVATAAMRSVLAVLSTRQTIRNVKIDADGQANYGIYLANAGCSQFDRVWATGALFDGINNSATGNNNHITLDTCYLVGNGKTYASAGAIAAFTNGREVAIAGSVATTASGLTLTFTGAPDLRTLGIRKGDIVAIGTTKLTASYHLIESVPTASTITLQGNIWNRPTATASGLDYAIGVGDGWSDSRNGNGAVGLFRNVISHSNGGSGYKVNCAYGHTIVAGDTSYNNFAGICFGVSDNVGAVYASSFIGVYCEGTAMCYYLGAGSVNIIGPTGVISDGAQLFVYAHDGIANANIEIGDSVYSWHYGKRQSFLLQINNNGGTLRHRIIADVATGGATLLTDRITGATNAYTNTPHVDAATPFAGGGGILNSSQAVFLFNTAQSQVSETDFFGVVEYNDTGTDYGVTIGTVSVNINGVTRTWPSFRLRNPTTGAQVSIDTVAIPAGKSICVRIQGRIR
jgi:hypothetical protein